MDHHNLFVCILVWLSILLLHLRRKYDPFKHSWQLANVWDCVTVILWMNHRNVSDQIYVRCVSTWAIKSKRKGMMIEYIPAIYKAGNVVNLFGHSTSSSTWCCWSHYFVLLAWGKSGARSGWWDKVDDKCFLFSSSQRVSKTWGWADYICPYLESSDDT